MASRDASVVIPTLDAVETIDAALDSVLDDQPLDVEVLVVDDGSQDGTVARVEARRDPRVRLLRTGRRRSGSGVARNLALEEVSGEWVAILDADDVFEPGRLPRLIGTARSKGSRVICDDVGFDRAGSGVATSLFAEHRVPRFERPVRARLPAIIEFDLGLTKPVFHASLLHEHGIRYEGYRVATDDFGFLFDLVAAAGGLLLAPQISYRYVIREGSESAPTPEFWLDAVRMTASLLQRPAATDEVTRRLLESRLHGVLTRYHYLQFRRTVASGQFRAAASTLVACPRAGALAIRQVCDRLQVKRQASMT